MTLSKELVAESVREEISKQINESETILTESERDIVRSVVRDKGISRAEYFVMAKGNDYRIIYRTNRNASPQMMTINNGKVVSDDRVNEKIEKVVTSLYDRGFRLERTKRRLMTVLKEVLQGGIFVGAIVVLATALGALTGLFVPDAFMDAGDLIDLRVDTPVPSSTDIPTDDIGISISDPRVDAAVDMGMSQEDAIRFIQGDMNQQEALDALLSR